MLQSHSVEPNKDDKVWEKAGGRVVNKDRYSNDRFGSQKTNTLKQCGRQNSKIAPMIILCYTVNGVLQM